MLSGDGLARIAAGASTLAERVAGEVQLEPGSAFTTDRRIARWAEQTARSDPDRFATRLDMDGLDAERARLVVGRARPRAGAPLPDWAVYLAEALADAARAARDPADRALLPEDPIPLEELSLPFLRAARARLERLAPADRADVAAPVVIGEERALLVRLGIVLSPVLDLELAIERDRRLGRLREAALRAEGWGGEGALPGSRRPSPRGRPRAAPRGAPCARAPPRARGARLGRRDRRLPAAPRRRPAPRRATPRRRRPPRRPRRERRAPLRSAPGRSHRGGLPLRLGAPGRLQAEEPPVGDRPQ